MNTYALLVWKDLLQGSTDPADLYDGYIVVALTYWEQSKQHLEEWVELARGTREEMETLHKLTNGVNHDIT